MTPKCFNDFEKSLSKNKMLIVSTKETAVPADLFFKFIKNNILFHKITGFYMVKKVFIA